MYQLKTDDIYRLAHFVNAETHEKGDELYFKLCPYCHGGTNGHDKNTFSVNMKTGAFKCFRSSCGKKGHLVEFARDFGFDLMPQKEFKRLPQNVEIRDEAMEFMKSRGISEAVARAYRITTQKDNKKVIVFPFFDENNVLRFVKYRNSAFVKGINKSKEWCEPNCMPILFGMNLCEGFERLIITEGQIDTLSLAEAGIKNAVSVPTGANGFTWFQYCEKWIKKFKKIIVFGDMENGKMTLIDDLRKKLPKTLIMQVPKTHYLGEKDANDILRKYGSAAVRKAVDEAELICSDCIRQLADIENIDTSSLVKIPTRIKDLDRVIEGIILGQVYVISGKAGEGKSTFASQLLATALEQGRRIFAYSGELPNYTFKNWIDLQLAGGEHINSTTNQFGNREYSISDSDRKIISDWYRDRAYIYDNTFVDDEETDLIPIIEQAICRYSAEVILIDNLMTAIECNADTLYHQQSMFVKSLCQIAKKYGVAVLLIAHPRKTAKGASFANDEVSGSSEVTKRVDVVINYERNRNKLDDDDNSADGLISVTKNRLTGRLTGKDKVEVFYSSKSKRIYGEEMNTGNNIFVNMPSEAFKALF